MIGKLLSLKRKNKYDDCLKIIEETRESLTSSIAVASMESYNHCYEYIVRLHILYELETFFFNNKPNPSAMNIDQNHSIIEISNILNIIESWDSRLKITMPLIRHRENILTVRRSIISLR